MFIHPLAYVDQSCSIGNGTNVWQFASVIRNSIIGKDCTIAANVCLDGANIGDRCIVSPGVDMGPGFLIESDVFLGPHVVLCNDFWPRTHKDNYDYDLLKSGEIVCVHIKSGASLGAGAKILPGVTIGKNAMISANAVVTTNVPDNCVWKLNGTIVHITDEEKIRRIRTCS